MMMIMIMMIAVQPSYARSVVRLSLQYLRVDVVTVWSRTTTTRTRATRRRQSARTCATSSGSTATNTSWPGESLHECSRASTAHATRPLSGVTCASSGDVISTSTSTSCARWRRAKSSVLDDGRCE